MGDALIVCRLCLENLFESENAKNVHHIFDEGLSNKIIILSGLDVSLRVQQGDALPKIICRECRYQLEKSYYFRNVAKRSDARLKKHIRLLHQNKPSKILAKDYQDEDDEEFNETFLDSFKYFEAAKESINQLRIDFENEKQDIIQKELEKVKINFSPPRLTRSRQIPDNPILLNKCAPSNQRFDNVPKVVRRQSSPKKSIIAPETETNTIVVEGYEIEILTQDENETPQAFEFSKISEDTPFEIAQETVLFADENMIEEVSGSDEDYRPSLEKVPTFAKQKPRKKQKISKSSSKRAEKKVFNNEQSAETSDDHYFKAMDDSDDLDENGEKKIFQCAFEGCNESFARRQACKTHFYNHLASKTVTNGYNCQFCQKTFKVQSALERHERVHTGDKPFSCDYAGCNKAFSQKEMLKRHKVIHLSIDDAPFSCQICEKKFRQKEPLRQHINKAHSEDSEFKSHPFGCSICSKKFAHSSGLSRHLLIHSGRRFPCEVCKKIFNDQSALKRHLSIHKKQLQN